MNVVNAPTIDKRKRIPHGVIDPVVNLNGERMGWVTSCTVDKPPSPADSGQGGEQVPEVIRGERERKIARSATFT